MGHPTDEPSPPGGAKQQTLLHSLVSQNLCLEAFPEFCLIFFSLLALSWLSVFGQVSHIVTVLSKSLSLLYAWSWRIFLLRRASGIDAEGVHCPLRVVGIDGLHKIRF